MANAYYDINTDLQLIAGRGAFLSNAGCTSYNEDMETLVLRNVRVGSCVLRSLSDLAESSETERELVEIVRENLEPRGRAKECDVFSRYFY